MSENTKPKLRFKDGQGRDYPNWQIDSIQNISDINPPARDKLPHSFVYIDLESVVKGRIIKYNVLTQNQAPSRAQRVLKPGDVLFQMVRPNQQNNLFFNLQGDYVASTGYALLRAKKSASFLYQLMHRQSFVNLVLARCSGTSYPAISSRDLGTIKVRVCCQNEQQKIANFLSAVDLKIEQLVQKLSLLKQYKKGLMQQLFSQELRFKDEQGREYPEWVEEDLGSMGTTFNGLTGKTRAHFGRGLRYIQYLQIFKNSKVELRDCGLVEIDLNESQNSVQRGDIFFTISSETPEDVGVTSVLLEEAKDVYLNSFCFGYRANRAKLLPEFARYAFREFSFRQRVVKLAQGSTRFNLSKISLMKLMLRLPSISEQQKIADSLTTFDEKLELLDKQIETSRSFKQGLLQQLFV